MISSFVEGESKGTTYAVIGAARDENLPLVEGRDGNQNRNTDSMSI